MRSIKLLVLTCVMTLASVSLAKMVLVDKVFVNSLDGHKTATSKLQLPAGKTSITVETYDEKAVISCQFINSSGVVGLEQSNTGKCWGNVTQSSDDTMTVSITNETDSLIDYRLHQISTSEK